MAGREAGGDGNSGMAGLLRRWRARATRGETVDSATTSEMAVWAPPEDAPGWTSEDASRWTAARNAQSSGMPWVDAEAPVQPEPTGKGRRR